MNIDHAKVVLTNKLFADKSVDINDNCQTLKISRTTLYRHLRMRALCPIATMRGGKDSDNGFHIPIVEERLKLTKLWR